MTVTPKLIKERIYSIDFLRGVVMMIMLLDHTREFIHTGAMQQDPLDLATTTPVLFFTRWITHFCAPVFVFLAGSSIFLQKMYGKSNGEVSRFLWTRGLWLIFLEFTVVRLGIFFNFDYSMFGLAQVIWVIGVSMIVMAALIYLPVRYIGALGLAIILLHNLLDRVQVPPNIAFGSQPPPDTLQSLWIILHQPGIVVIPPGSAGFFAYPVLPWLGVMTAGFAFGKLYELKSDRRRKWIFALGGGATLLFIVLRLINLYGDPAPWSVQSTPIFTVMSFLNTTKYGPSLVFLLMTLGPGILVLALTDRIDGTAIWQRVSIVFGRVPMFYYILQWYYAHGIAILLSYLAGKDFSYLTMNLMDSGRSAPPGHGFPLWVVYVVWIAGLVLLYPLCRWWGNVKKRNKHWTLSYL